MKAADDLDQIALPSEPEVGEIYDRQSCEDHVDFGAFRELLRSAKDGLVHISAAGTAAGSRKVSDIVNEGDKVWVKLMGFDDRGKVRLSMKVVDQETGKEIEKETAE